MLTFQVPGAPSGYLLEHLLLASIGAVRGGGIFAWTNVNGIKSLLEDEVFDEFLLGADFQLIVGTDSITDTAAVTRLADLCMRRPHLDARAFVSSAGSLFHPKLCWFEHADRLVVVVGSGNLTMGGLRGNWEAFSIEELVEPERATVLAQLDSFVAAHEKCLLPLSDPRVLDRVKENTGNERSLRTTAEQPTAVEPVASAVAEVLLAEIPRAGDRWAQANFDQDNYEQFFGAKVGSQRRISLHHVDGDGSVAEFESRPSVEVVSQNFRFELAAARGLAYPVDGRPVGVFLRLTTGEFLYMLLLPGDDGYREIDDALTAVWTGRPDRMRRVRVTVDELRLAWPDSPLWGVTLPAL